MYYTYVLISVRDGRLYTGTTSDLKSIIPERFTLLGTEDRFPLSITRRVFPKMMLFAVRDTPEKRQRKALSS